MDLCESTFDYLRPQKYARAIARCVCPTVSTVACCAAAVMKASWLTHVCSYVVLRIIFFLCREVNILLNNTAVDYISGL